MRWNSRYANRTFISFCLLALAPAFAVVPVPADSAAVAQGPVEMSFMKGDTRNGSKVHLRIVGDSLHYTETSYHPDSAPIESRKSILLNGQRRRALHGVLGDLPRHPAFGTCFGKDMRFYMVETAEGRFYRSLPLRAGKCYTDEPGIWSLFQDLDDLLAPPRDPDYLEYSAS
ncbi:MAG: hypothetical protein JWP91_895 [Fibrobacteres bacterium]|nr:hypothetical protein [Fibrobacterota bacterium]